MIEEDDVFYYPQPMKSDLMERARQIALRNRPPIVEELQATWLEGAPWIWTFSRPARVRVFEAEGELAGARCTSLRVGNFELLTAQFKGEPIPLALLCGIGPPGRELIRIPAQEPGIQLALQIEGFKGRLRPLGKIVL